MVAIPLNYISVDERGVAYISGTRMKVRHIVIDRVAGGMPPEEIQQAHPHLSLAQIHAALTYYRDHQSELDVAITARSQEVERLRQGTRPSPLVERVWTVSGGVGCQLRVRGAATTGHAATTSGGE